MSKIVKYSSTKKLEEHKTSVFIEYPAKFNKLAVGISVVNGRYPAAGFDVDTQVEQVWYVESGRGQINLKDKVFDISPGDLILITPGDKYWIQGESLKLVVSSSPPWFEQQHQHVQ